MGDFRITIEGTGNHGCGRKALEGEKVERCGERGCVDCLAVQMVKALKESGAAQVELAELAHWPDKNLDGTVRREKGIGPVDDLLSGVRAIGDFWGDDPNKPKRGELEAKKLVDVESMPAAELEPTPEQG